MKKQRPHLFARYILSFSIVLLSFPVQAGDKDPARWKWTVVRDERDGKNESYHAECKALPRFKVPFELVSDGARILDWKVSPKNKNIWLLIYSDLGGVGTSEKFDTTQAAVIDIRNPVVLLNSVWNLKQFSGKPQKVYQPKWMWTKTSVKVTNTGEGHEAAATFKE